MSRGRVSSAARGFTFLEFVVVIIVIAILAGFALDRLLPLIGRAERASFLQVRTELQSALMLEAADRITRGESATLPEIVAINPMTMLLDPPANYRGTVQAAVRELERASWYYDEGRERLVYRVGTHTRFDPLDGPADRIELRVAFVYRDGNGDDVYSPSADRFDGLRLESVHGYSWPD
jgi:prepilin-type N-terminal cleavage/methylation domain-containing protein